MGIPTDQVLREQAMPTVPVNLSVNVNAAAGAWVTLTPPSGVPTGDLNAYQLILEGASADYEVTWKATPGTPDRGITIQAGIPFVTPRFAPPTIANGSPWPSFRATGGSGFTLRMVFCYPLP
jgi:hypothetical protein